MSKIITKIFLDNNIKKEYHGYVIEYDTDNQIFLKINTFQSCCEIWGHEIEYLPTKPNPNTEDSKEDFIGAKVLSVNWLPDEKRDDCGIKVKVKVITDHGDIILKVWNDHNGYYPHQVHAYWENYDEKQSI